MACVNENVYWLEWGQVRSVPTSVPMLKKVFELMISIWHFKVFIHSPTILMLPVSSCAD